MKNIDSLVGIIFFPLIVMIMAMGLHNRIDFPKKEATITVDGTFFYDGKNNDPGWREYDWDGELISTYDNHKRYAVSRSLRECFSHYAKADIEVIFNKPTKAELLIAEKSDDKFEYGDGKADLIWGIQTDKINTNSIDGLDNWYYGSWKYPLRFWAPLLILIVFLIQRKEDLKKRKPLKVYLAIFVAVLPSVVYAVWYYLFS